MINAIGAMEVSFEQDVVLVRQHARQIAESLGFSPQDQTRVATAVSEITRNAFNYAGGGRVEFAVNDTGITPSFLIRVTDSGPGIPNLASLLAGRGAIPGMGLLSARRLMDRFRIESTPGQGTTVTLEKDFPVGRPGFTRQELTRLSARLARSDLPSPVEELRHQNQELLQVMEELRTRQDELTRLNRELEDTNRGVLALYAELEERANQLRQATELKSRFLSYMSHEFRTPLNAILTLSQILLERMDGELTAEQEKQVGFIRKAAGDLTELTNDLLNLAKIEAGKLTVTPGEVEVSQLFGTLRGMMRPLEVNPAVNLVFETKGEILPLYTDEGKVAQILRNLISNALKFTEQGEVRVAVELAGANVIFSVADTGIGIAPEDQERIFEDFTQLESRLHRRTEGTGLGLALSRRLARLLGGTLTVVSQPGLGSTFTTVIPRVYSLLHQQAPGPAGAQPDTLASLAAESEDHGRGANILIIDDDEMDRYTFKKLLENTGYTVNEAANGANGLRQLQTHHPQVIFLDLTMPEMDGFEVLERLRVNPATSPIPVIIYTSKQLSTEERHQVEGTAALLSKQGISSQRLITEIETVLHQARGGSGYTSTTEDTPGDA